MDTRYSMAQRELFDGLFFTSDHHMPKVNPYLGDEPKELISFNRACSLKEGADAFVHFYISDVLFNCFWNNPQKYLKKLRNFKGVISPDYSLYAEMLYPELMFNSFKNKALAAWLQKNGIPVIPNVSWARNWSYNFCFEGFPKNSVIAINSTGIRTDSFSKALWINGYRKVLKILEPIHIIRYGAKQDGELESISTYYPNDNYKSAIYGR